jgi:hypothetical protein
VFTDYLSKVGLRVPEIHHKLTKWSSCRHLPVNFVQYRLIRKDLEGGMETMRTDPSAASLGNVWGKWNDTSGIQVPFVDMGRRLAPLRSALHEQHAESWTAADTWVGAR